MFYIKAAGGTNGAELQIYKLGKDNQGDLKSRTNETKLKICFTYLLMNLLFRRGTNETKPIYL